MYSKNNKYTRNIKQNINFVHFFGMVLKIISFVVLLNWRHNGTIMNHKALQLTHSQFFELAPKAITNVQGPRTQQPEQLGK